jgi:hypothetical protein
MMMRTLGAGHVARGQDGIAALGHGFAPRRGRVGTPTSHILSESKRSEAEE